MANAVVASELMVKMAVDYASMKVDMEKVAGIVGTNSERMAGAIDLAKKAFVGFIGIASINAFRDMVMGAIEGIAKFNDLATTAGVGADKLMALAGVAKFSGVSAETLAGSMNKLNMQLTTQGEAGGNAGAALKALGIDFKSFVAMSPDERMMAIAKAMDQYQDGSEKSAIAMALFGKSGAELVPMMGDLAKVGTLQAKVTAEQIAQAENFEDNLTRLKASGEGWKKEVAFGMLPALDDAAQAMLDVANQTGGLRDGVKKLSKDGMIEEWTRTAITLLSYVADAGEVVWRAFKTIGNTTAAAVAQIVASVKGMAGAVSKALAGDFSGAVDELRAGFEATKDVGASWADQEKQNWSDPTVGARMRERMEAARALRQATKEAGDETSAAKPKLDTSALMKGNAEATAKVKDEYAKQEKALRDFLVVNAQKIELGTKEIEQGAPITAGQKMIAEADKLAREGKILLNDAMRESIALMAQQLDAVEREKKWAEESHKANIAALDDLAKKADAIEQETQKQNEANETYGLAAEQLARLKVARLEELAVQADKNAENARENLLNEELADQYDRLAKAYRASAEAVNKGDHLRAAKEAADEWQKTVDSVTNGLTDGLMRAFESGKGFGKAFRDTLVNAFKTMVLQPVIKAIIAPVGAGLGSLFGAGDAMAGGMGGGGGGGGIMSLLSAGSEALGLGSMSGLGSIFNTGYTLSMNGLAGGALEGAGSMMANGSFMQGAAQGAGALAPYALGAVAGVKLGRMVSGGYSIGGSGNAPVNIGTAIGAIWGPIGSAIGGAIGGLVNRAFGMKPKETKASGIEGTIGGGDVSGRNFADWFQKGGWFRSNKSGTDYSAMSDQMSQALDLGAKTVFEQVKGWAEVLKLPGEELGKVTKDFRIALTGDQKTDSAELDKLFTGYQDALSAKFAALVAPFQKAGEKVADTLARLSSLTTFSETLNQFGGIFSRIAAASLDAREAMVKLAGGIDNLIAISGQFVKDYYTKDEQAGLMAKQVQEALKSVGLDGSALGSREDFRKLVESLDPNNPEQQKQLVALLALGPQFAQLGDYLKEQTKTVADVIAATPQTSVLEQLIQPTKSTGQAVTDLSDTIKQGNKTLDQIFGEIRNGNERSEGLLGAVVDMLRAQSIYAQQNAQASAQSAAQLTTIARASALSASSPSYAFDMGAER